MLNCQFSKKLNIKYRKFNEEKRSIREVFECVVKWKDVGIQCKTLLVRNFGKLYFMFRYYNFSFNYNGIQIFSTSQKKWKFVKTARISRNWGYHNLLQWNKLCGNGVWFKLSRSIKKSRIWKSWFLRNFVYDTPTKE